MILTVQRNTATWRKWERGTASIGPVVRHVHCTFPIFKALIAQNVVFRWTGVYYATSRAPVTLLVLCLCLFSALDRLAQICELIKQRLCVGSEEGRGGRTACCACRWSGIKMTASPKTHNWTYGTAVRSGGQQSARRNSGTGATWGWSSNISGERLLLKQVTSGSFGWRCTCIWRISSLCGWKATDMAVMHM